MAMSLLRRMAAAGPVPVFAVAGENGLATVEDLALDPGIALQDSPRHAALLLVHGPVRAADREDLRRLHDQLPHPRATAWWGTEPAFEHAPGRDDLLHIKVHPTTALSVAYRDLLSGFRATEPDLLPDRPPFAWRGKGDFGQGGEGMMGGTPYGRPMAMTDDDLRDGLALDAYTTEIGPFLPMLPPGLVLEVTLQGDVIQAASVKRPPFAQADDTPLRRIVRLVRLLGLPALAERILRDGDSGVERQLWRAGVFAALPPELGIADCLRVWCSGQDTPTSDPAERLPGLEWHEAMLVLNSVGRPAP